MSTVPKSPRCLLGDESLENEPGLSVTYFPTALGYMGVVATKRGVVAVRVGYADPHSLVDDLRTVVEVPAEQSLTRLGKRLVAFAAGRRDDFLDVSLDTRFVLGGAWTPFREKVTSLCRAISPGEVKTYRELAEWAGAPRGSRAVGGVMARNPWPVIVPCHRVIGSGGGLGGYSAPLGLGFKRQLLAMEAESSSNLV